MQLLVKQEIDQHMRPVERVIFQISRGGLGYVLGGVGLLQSRLCERTFEHLSSVYLLLNSAACDEPVHYHMPLLAYAERPVYALGVHCTYIMMPSGHASRTSRT
jgi:hypothetical protein